MAALEPFRTPPASSPPASEPADTPSEASVPSLRVLLAEDNLINQKLTLRILEQQGHDVTVVTNGQEALAAYDPDAFDLVLMDVQMPLMDGYEATARIREREAQTNTHMPIIALTARAMQGDRERCLDAGMDDYISKPMRKQKVQEVIQRNGPYRRPDEAESVEAGSGEATPSTEDRPPALDWDVLLDRFGGDWSFIDEVTALFVEERAVQTERIEAAIEAGDAEALQHAAHTLKGAAANLHAEPTREAALRLETIGASGDLSSAREAYGALRRELDRFEAAVEAMQEQQAFRAGV